MLYRIDLLYYIFRRWPTVQFLATISGSLNVISSGMHYGWSSPSLPLLMSNASTIPITSAEGSTIAMVLPIGTLTGCVLVACIVDRIGRRKTILFTSIPAFSSWMLLAFAPNVGALIVGRYIGGISDGMIFCAMNIYVSEIANPKYRGLLGSTIGITYALGHLLINIIGFQFRIAETAFVCSTLPLMLLLTFYWMPESPYYLLMKKNHNEAKRSLAILHGTEDNCESDLIRIARGLEEQKTNSSSIWDLITVPKIRKILLTIFVLRGVQQGSGDTAILFYTQEIFFNVIGEVSAQYCTIGYLSIELIVVIFASFIVDKAGRKPLLIISMGGCGATLFTISVYFFIRNRTGIDVSNLSFIPIAALIGYVIMFGIALQSIPISIAGELFPTNVKSYGVAVSDVYFAIVAAGISKYFQITKDMFGLEIPFLTFAIICVLGIIYVVLFLVETKNKTLEAIQHEIKP